MDDRARRKALTADYRRSRPDAGVYRLVNTHTGRSLLGTTPNLPSLRNRIDFARSMNSVGALDGRLANDAREFGVEAFTLEVLEVVEQPPEMTRAQLLDELHTLEALWREKFEAAALY